MFDRLLGPKTDHADPKVRAKAYALDSVDEGALNQALSSEQDADVLCVILSRATEVSAVLAKASQSTGSLANEARSRLAVLATQDASASAEDWQAVYTEAYAQEWTQIAALHDALGVGTGRERVLEGALLAQPQPAKLAEKVLVTLATQSQGSQVRRLAASQVHSDDALQACCDALKDKDKAVYRVVKQKLEARKRLEELKALAQDLEADIAKLETLSVTAQPESLAVAQARRQTLEDKVNKLQAEDAQIGQPLRTSFDRAVATVDAQIRVAHEHAGRRKTLKTELEMLLESVSQSDGEALTDLAKNLDTLAAQWLQVPDHSESDKAEFERALQRARDELGTRTADRDVYARLIEKIALWTAQSDGDTPDKLRKTIERDWDSCEKPQNSEQQAELQQQISALVDKLKQKSTQLALKRTANSEQMLKILEDFSSRMEAGEFKKAMSLNDKLRARAANRELDPAARQRIEDVLKKAQPRLEEFRKWRHFGTQQARDSLIGQANTLISEPPASPKTLSVQVKALRDAWRKLDQDDGRASEAVWQTFSRACKEAYKPAKKHFDQLAKERKTNLSSRKAVLEKLQALLDETDWNSPDWPVVTKAHRELQLEWQRGGTVDYKVKKDIEAQYEKLSTRFDAQFKDEREYEIERRRRLIDRLKQAQEGEIDGRAAAAAKRAQKEWRPTVQSDRKTEQALWKEFRAVCDGIFDTLKTQQKESKAAWQAEAKARENLLVEVDALLVTPPSESSDDVQLARQAKGTLDELAKQWRTRHQIPSGIAGKLDARFKQARQSAQARIAKVLARESERQEQRLMELLDICQSAEAAAVQGGANAAEFEGTLAEFEQLKGVSGKGLCKRFRQALAALGGDGDSVNALRSATDENLAARLELCLRGELVADIESPVEVQEARMALKMKRLTQAMQGELETPEQELEAIVEQWMLIGGVAGDEWPLLKARFAQVQAARR